MADTGDVRGYIRQRPGRDALEAVIDVPGRGTVRRATGYRVGQEAEAERFMCDVIRELEAAAPADAGVLTFQAWGEQWIAERKARGLVSAFDEDAHLRFHAYPQLGAVPLSAVTKAQTLEWVRGLPRRVSHQKDRPLSPRYVHHVASTVRRLMSEAVDRDLLAVSPCTWKTKRDLPAKMDSDPSKRRAGGFQPAEVAALLFDARIPQERRVLYALEFLTGMRTGEAAARRWSDVDASASPLQRLEVRTAWNTRTKTEKGTKTLVEKVVPVHPLLASILAAWWAGGWVEYVGREPTAEDIIVPAERGDGKRPRNASRSNKLFQQDLRTLGLRATGAERRTHYETRSTFRSLSLAGGAVRSDLDLITHPSPRQASDLYTRLDVIWPALCRAIGCVTIPVPPDTNGECTTGCTNEAPENEKARPLAEIGPLGMAGCTGLEAGYFGASGRSDPPSHAPESARTEQRADAEPAGSRRGCSPAAAALAALLGQLGSADEARKVLEEALRSVDGSSRPALRVVKQ